jgi:hypothetical protein
MPGARLVAHQVMMVAQIQELSSKDRCRTIQDIAEEVGIGYGICRQILTKELGMHHVAASP